MPADATDTGESRAPDYPPATARAYLRPPSRREPAANAPAHADRPAPPGDRVAARGRRTGLRGGRRHRAGRLGRRGRIPAVIGECQRLIAGQGSGTAPVTDPTVAPTRSATGAAGATTGAT